MKSTTINRSRSIFAACLFALAAVPAGVAAFTQHAGGPLGNPLPMGHEWITRLAAIEVLDGKGNPDPGDPRNGWPGGQGKAKNLDLGSAAGEVRRIKDDKTDENVYAASYKLVWDAIIGERWVDIGGTNIAKSMAAGKAGSYNCFDLVAQEPVDIQYDHFMRRYDDNGARGGLAAAQASKARFIQYFVAAATAQPGAMDVWDGGGYAVKVSVDRNYFLLGRALHLFEDSFSPDHTVRTGQDRYEKVRQVKSYLCATGSEQHSHSAFLPAYGDGDVIWKPDSQWKTGDWSSYKPANMKDVALVATEASKDVWAAFIRTMAAPPATRAGIADKEARAVAAQWLAVHDDKETLTWYTHAEHRLATYVKSASRADDNGNGKTQAMCMSQDFNGLTQAQKVAQLELGQKVCLYNMVPTGEHAEMDASLRLPYNWDWRNADSNFTQPPPGWKIGDTRYVNVRIANRVNGQFMQQKNHYLYNTPQSGGSLVEFTVPLGADLRPDATDMVLKVVGDPGYYMNRAGDSWGLVALWQSTNKGHFRFERRADGYYNIKNVDDNLYIYMHTDNQTYLNKDGNPDNPNAQWRIDGLPEPYPANGMYRNDTSSYALSTNGDGKIMTRRYQGMGAQFMLMRQADGSYTIQVPGRGYIRTNRQDRTLSYDATAGSKFFLDKREDGKYLVRDEDGMYWRIDPPESIVRTDASASCSMDPCNPVISGPDEGQRPACSPEMSIACTLATPLGLSRDWSH